MLDDMDLERERGITIKSHAIQMGYKAQDGKDYILNLIDTPGHVDFSYEVSRSIAACEGALLVVDATQGVQAQTISNLYMAIEHDLEIIPVINKIDMPNAMPDEVEDEIIELLGCKREEIICASGKTGEGVERILEAVIARIPAPVGDPEAPAQALIFDSIFNSFRGVIVLCKVVNGCIKKGEKVDYAIMDEDQNPLILIEAKCHDEDLGKHGSQLFRYFGTSTAKFGILTNGIIYRFYTDLESPNKMDDRPFLELNLLDIKDGLVPELKKFQKSAFDLDTILTTASELKYNNQIKQLLAKQLEAPSDEFVTYVLNNVYDGRKTQKIIEDFRGTVKKSFVQFINEQVNDRLKTALGSEDSEPTSEESHTPDSDDTNTEEQKPKIVTTQEELEAFFIIKALVHDSLGTHDLVHKDTETYFGVLLDGNTRKWICRLQLEGKKKLILPDDNKKYINFPIESINDLYKYKEELESIIRRYIEDN